MRKIFFIIALLNSFLASALTNNTGTIIFYRDNSFAGNQLANEILLNDSLISRIKSNTYYEMAFEPGEHLVVVRMNNKKKYQRITVLPNQITYIHISAKNIQFSTYPTLEATEAEIATNILSKSSMKQINEPVKKRVNRKGSFQIMIGYNVGADSSLIFSDSTYGDNVLSFGGGYSIHTSYTYEFNKFLSFNSEISYQFSPLHPTVKTGNYTFNRIYISASPGFSIPLSTSKRTKLKFSGGGDLYIPSQLRIRMTKALKQEYDDNWNYNTTFGWHAEVALELEVKPMMSLVLSGRYYQTQFSLDPESMELLDQSISDRILNPDGSGIGLKIGLIHHF